MLELRWAADMLAAMVVASSSYVIAECAREWTVEETEEAELGVTKERVPPKPVVPPCCCSLTPAADSFTLPPPCPFLRDAAERAEIIQSLWLLLPLPLLLLLLLAVPRTKTKPSLLLLLRDKKSPLG
jgi:hypothetical protein